MRINQQQGASLISMMIGLLVSMICILAVMSMHKGLVRVAIDSKKDAVHDGLVNSALVQLKLALQNAGFGMETATAADVVTDLVNGGPVLYWRYVEAGNPVCRGVREQVYNDADSGTAGRRLVLVEDATANCTLTADLAQLTWTELSTLGQFRDQANSLFTFSVAPAECTPFGFGVAKSHLQVSVSALTSAEVNGAAAAGADISNITYQYCLANIHL